MKGKWKFALSSVLLFCIITLIFCCIYKYPTKGNEAEMLEKTQEESEANANVAYVLNKNTKKFHHSYCYSIDMMKEENKINFYGNREVVINQGYNPCKNCKP